jgi:hypothetical protein
MSGKTLIRKVLSKLGTVVCHAQIFHHAHFAIKLHSGLVCLVLVIGLSFDVKTQVQSMVVYIIVLRADAQIILEALALYVPVQVPRGNLDVLEAYFHVGLVPQARCNNGAHRNGCFPLLN